MPIHDWTRVKAGIFHDFHVEWITAIKHALNKGILPPDHYAMAEQVSGRRIPDVLTLERRGDGGAPGKKPPPGGANGGVALAVQPPAVQFTAAEEAHLYARKRNRIAIRHVSGDDLVAVLEIVSPGNKIGKKGIESFVDKALEFLEAGIHLLILDLHPPGSRDPQGMHGAIWTEISDDPFQLPPDKQLTLASYMADFATIKAFIQPLAVGDTLPDMPLFLKPETYVPVPLEATYQSAFEAVPQRWREVLEK